MSHEVNTKLREEFMSTLTEVMACPYCGTITADLCCGEIHAEVMLDNGSEIFPRSEIEAYYAAWLVARPEPITELPDPMGNCYRPEED